MPTHKTLNAHLVKYEVRVCGPPCPFIMQQGVLGRMRVRVVRAEIAYSLCSLISFCAKHFAVSHLCLTTKETMSCHGGLWCMVGLKVNLVYDYGSYRI